MPLTFNTLLRDAGLSLNAVRLLRHETQQHGSGRTPYALWRDDRGGFEDYQRIQKRERRSWFRGAHWASFVVAPDGRTLFAGLYAVDLAGDVPPTWEDPLAGRDLDFAAYELYRTVLCDELAEYIGRLVIDWGIGARQWAQLAGNQDKVIVELRERFIEPAFPGFARFIAQLSDLETLPAAWKAALVATRGVYLLSCPQTCEQYVGSATGADGFFGRWLAYVADGHGGNVGLKTRKPSDYRVSILQVAGSADDRDAILAMEAIWKDKLQSREMGLNRN
ncbi:MAG: uncharacterized protein JWL96_2588 [Sphingomonas bacterium]|uniref:GIY-YIG nuclease family protein n=1 Tax=Sphingomonas bacterium TaxID=1895847 RepID=UPI0026260380|nr:GIY-YIG nuclease family protein [Sphingomonas bacterium]MDB5710518.1 uncharacterized protein [Sphingomonas bacterium]